MASVKENLVKMKSTSEKMLELAYSAVFLQDKEIVSQVNSLFETLQHFEGETLEGLFRVDLPEKERIVIINLANNIVDIGRAAKDIADLSNSRNFPDIVKDIFKGNKLAEY